MGDKEMPFLDHIEELRWHIIRALSVIIVFMMGAFISGSWIFEHLLLAVSRSDFVTFNFLCVLGKKLHLEDALCIEVTPFKIQSRIMTGQFTMHIVFSFVIGFILAFPYVFWEIWRFILPGLHDHEKKPSYWMVLAVSLLFLTGVAFGYFIMSPLAIAFLSSYSISDTIVNEFDITSYVSTVAVLILGSGLFFQLPVAVYFLSKIGIVTPQLMKQYRKHALISIVILGAVITPPDPLSQSLISIPLYILYEASIFISAFAIRVSSHKIQSL